MKRRLGQGVMVLGVVMAVATASLPVFIFGLALAASGAALIEVSRHVRA